MTPTEALDALYRFASRTPLGDQARAVLLALIESTAARESGGGWRQIETAPKDGTEVVLAYGTTTSPAEWFGKYSWQGGHWYHADKVRWVEFPTHWAPLPGTTAPSPGVDWSGLEDLAFRFDVEGDDRAHNIDARTAKAYTDAAQRLRAALAAARKGDGKGGAG